MPSTHPDPKPQVNAEPSLRELYDAHWESMYRTAYRIMGSPSDAQDVVQDVFVGLPDALRRYQERGSMAGWLNKITVRLALSRLRARSRRGEIPFEPTGPLPANRPHADAVIARTTLERALARLPADLRIVFVLKEAEGYSHAEIADLLDIRVGTSEVRLHRAKRQLRLYLRNER